MERKKGNRWKGQLKWVGFFILLIGIIVVLSVPLGKIKEIVYSEMKLAIYQAEINEDNETISNIPLENINDTTQNNNETSSNNEEVVSYTYIGQLSIPIIKFKRGFVAKDSKYNDINYNIAIAKEADYPDVKNGNFILMAHSGDAVISFFEPLYKLKLGDVATVTYQAKAYYYQLVKTYEVEKTGKIAIYRDYNKKTLTLITCTHMDDTKQSVYIFEQTRE